jgi:hypothetical protein
MSVDRGQGDQTLSLREQARLAGILSRLASSFAGERAAAGLLATDFLARHNLTWRGLVETARTNSDLPPNVLEAPAKSDRRRTRNTGWRGYCRRRQAGRGGVLDLPV